MKFEISGIVSSNLINSDPVRTRIGSGMNKIGPSTNKTGSGTNKTGSGTDKSLRQSMATNKFGSGTNKNRIWYE